MKDIFMLYIGNSLWLSLVILTALAFFYIFRKGFSARLPCIVWLIIALKLVIPWNLPLPQPAGPIEVPVAGQIMAPSVSQIGESGAIYGGGLQGRLISIEDIASCLWLGGAIVLLTIAVYRNSKLKRELNIYSKAAPEWLNAMLASSAAQMGMKPPKLNICDRTVSPMAAGLFSPEIYLPRDDYGNEAEMILRHELTHIKRGDLYFKLLYTAAKILNWFNPLVYLMTAKANEDLEISCDADVVRQRDMDYRKRYSLIILEQAKASCHASCITTCFSCGKSALKARFTEILTTGSRRSGKSVILLTLMLSLVCGVFVSCKPSASAGYEQMAKDWAQALEERNGEIRYSMMSDELQKAFEEEQGTAEDGKLIYSIGWSSPWVTGYTVSVDKDSATIHYTLETSIPETYHMNETIYFGEENGKTVVIDYVTYPLVEE